ncbi:LemA protein [Natronocella acetinitrilica]|uniref:LemA protein n=1 Tax=Natronocella acetinitrilica TaxID=414046 RepID=A0AAE3G5G9_9GAMM|nr:LemA family protein [Natronocella acetinitrilica]MCP1675086.1 LemA protein [Natronocella acetinitrilica]
MELGTIIFLLIIVGLIGYVVSIYNRLVRLRNQVRNGWRQIDVQLKRRHDLIPNLVETVKDYMSYEQDTLRQVVEARSRAVATEGKGPEASMAAEQGLSGALGKLFALMENYPDLKASQNVQQLMEELASTENRIAFSRQHYNDSVMAKNVAVESFPSNIVAGLFGFRQDQYFEVETHERAVPKVSLR